MEAHPVDPRDIEIEFYDPTYRVVFWSEGRADEYDVTNAPDVNEVLAWAQERASSDQQIVVYALADRTAVRVFGSDPSRNEG